MRPFDTSSSFSLTDKHRFTYCHIDFLTHTFPHTHTLWSVLCSGVDRFVSQCVRLAPETGVIRSNTHTHTVWIAVGNIWDGFPRNVLACLRNVSLLSSPLSSSSSLSFLPYRVGVEREDNSKTTCQFLNSLT